MTTSFQSGRNIFIQEGQSPAEQRFGLNLMINVMSQNTDKEKRSKLDPNVHKIAEVLLITQTSMLLNKEQLITLWGAWNSDEISLKDKQLIINQLSGGTFSEKPVEEKKFASPSWQRSRYIVSDGSESEAEPDQDRQNYRSEVETRAMSEGQFKGFLDGLKRNSTSSAQSKVREEELMEKYMQNVSKFDKGHMIAMTEHVLYPKASTENQGRAIENIFLSIDTKTQGLIEIPIASDHETQIQITSMQGSIALACLIKNIYGQDISKQVKAIQALFQEYPQHLQDLSKFKRTVLAEIAIHESLWRYNSKPSDKKHTENDFCEMLLRSVAKVDSLHARELGRQLEAPDSRLRMETVLVELEENQKILERLEIESPAKSKSGAANSSDKKSAKQMVANPAIQQPSSCPLCGLNHDISQCKKEEARLNADAMKRGGKFPGADKSASRNSPRQKQECEDKTDEHYGSSSGS